MQLKRTALPLIQRAASSAEGARDYAAARCPQPLRMQVSTSACSAVMELVPEPCWLGYHQGSPNRPSRLQLRPTVLDPVR